MTSEPDLFFDVGEKYKTVLNALLEKNYHIINDVYLNMFISHLSGKNGEGKYEIAIFFQYNVQCSVKKNRKKK